MGTRAPLRSVDRADKRLASLHPLLEAFIVGRLSDGGPADMVMLGKHVRRLARTILDVSDELTAVAGAQCRRSVGLRKAIIGTMLTPALQSVLYSRTPDLLRFGDLFDADTHLMHPDNLATFSRCQFR